MTKCLGLSFRLRLELVSSRSFVAELPPLLGRLANLALFSQKAGFKSAVVLVAMFLLGVLFKDLTSLG